MRLIDEGGDGLVTMDDLANTGSISKRYDQKESIFAENTAIRFFDEFQYFTNIKVLGQSSFQACKNLERITLPAGVKEIAGYYLDNTAISKIVVPEGVEIVGAAFVASCQRLEYIEFPSTIKSIGTDLLYNSRATPAVVVKSTTPPSFGGFGWYTDGTIIYVPDGSVSTYQAHSDWKSFADIIHPLSEYVG